MALTSLAAAAAAALLASGLLLAIAGLRKVAPRPAAPARTGRAQSRWATVSARTRLLLLGAGLLGALVAVATGWILAILILPLAAVGLPWLLSAPESTTRIDRLQAMEEWTRSLAGILSIGLSLEDALTVTLRSTPAPIHPEVSTLVARLRARWPTDQAIRAFADDLNDSTGDLIAANLALAAQRRGTGLAQVLTGLAESVAADVRARRAIEADRAKPRATARWITIITVAVLALLALNGGYVAPYKTPLGQVILLALLATYAALLIWLRSMAKGQPLPRFIGQSLVSSR